MWIDPKHKPARGVDVLAVCPTDKVVYFAYWDDHKDQWRTSEHGTPIEVTHWMPIPTIPGEPHMCPMCAHEMRAGHGCDNCEGIPTRYVAPPTPVATVEPVKSTSADCCPTCGGRQRLTAHNWFGICGNIWHQYAKGAL